MITLSFSAVILETKKGVYQCANSANYTSPNRAENYEFYRQTGRSIARSIVDWYLYVIHLVKLNTLSDNRIEFLGESTYLLLIYSEPLLLLSLFYLQRSSVTLFVLCSLKQEATLRKCDISS